MVHFKVTLFLSLMLIHANTTIMQCNALFHVFRVKYVLFVSVFIFIYIYEYFLICNFFAKVFRTVFMSTA